MWDIAWDLWEHRNEVLFQATNVVSEAELRTLNRNVRNNFIKLQALLLPAHDRHLISLDLPRLLKKDKVYKVVWLQNSAVVIDGRCQTQWLNRNAKAQMIRGMKLCMRQFLRPT